jgi:hypothetical protein
MGLTPDPPLTAADVCRGSCRLLWLQGWSPLTEVTLADGHRADIMATDARGALLIIEVKVSAADLLGDCKWHHYRAFADRFAWAVPQALAPLTTTDRFLPAETGLIVADRHEGVWVREAATTAVPPARRRAALLMLARAGADRALRVSDPGFDGFREGWR